MKRHFGNELLYALYEFSHEMHYEPDSWEKVFDFIPYMKVRSIFMDLARMRAKAADNG